MSASSDLNDRLRQGAFPCVCVPYDPLIGQHNINCKWASAVQEIYRLGRLDDENDFPCDCDFDKIYCLEHRGQCFTHEPGCKWMLEVMRRQGHGDT